MFLEEEFLTSNIAQMTLNTTLKPQSATLCLLRIRNKLEKEQSHYMDRIYSEYLSNFPGISVTTALVRINNYKNPGPGTNNSTA